ncbi:hypothetical protein Igag_1969 [Ignisphaera aggregans DSM 17230]|uniref:Uncharacterized protein n=1 Tax=Ignisphaera aggregans (strain DSM 17230 / JCM 13409 / AQ1.S1) TaxID=583356 RepID=E0STH5_IGNAA|nr:hypothetical protein Igag_1969 [Ignisphaera aggregans DSM 17230]
MSKDLLSKLDKITIKGQLKTLHVFDVRTGQTNLALVAISDSAGRWSLESVYVPRTYYTKIVNALKQAFENERLLKVIIQEIRAARIVSISSMEPSEITIRDFVELVKNGKISNSTQRMLVHTIGKIIEIRDGLRFLFNYNSSPIVLRVYKNSSLWTDLLIEDHYENPTRSWEAVVAISLTTQSVVQHQVYEINEETLMGYGPVGAFSLYAILPIRPVDSEESSVTGAQVAAEESTTEDGEYKELVKAIAESARKIVEMATGDGK